MFQVKSGGHTVNRGFSSTQGIQIYTEKFTQVTYDAASGTAVIGTGLIWDTVYERLQEYNVVVLGGRVPGVSGHCNSLSWEGSQSCCITDRRRRLCTGRRFVPVPGGFSVALYTDGSLIGYSYKTNQYGLCLDTIVGYTLVLPNGTVTDVTQSTHPDLFWGLKGGFNNFVGPLFLTLSPFRSAYFLPGNRDGLHDEDFPTNPSMGMYFHRPPKTCADSDPRADQSRTFLPLSVKSAPLLQTSLYIPRTRRLRLFPRTLALKGTELSAKRSFMMARLHHLAPSTTSQTSHLVRAM